MLGIVKTIRDEPTVLRDERESLIGPGWNIVVESNIVECQVDKGWSCNGSSSFSTGLDLGSPALWARP